MAYPTGRAGAAHIEIGRRKFLSRSVGFPDLRRLDWCSEPAIGVSGKRLRLIRISRYWVSGDILGWRGRKNHRRWSNCQYMHLSYLGGFRVYGQFLYNMAEIGFRKEQGLPITSLMVEIK